MAHCMFTGIVRLLALAGFAMTATVLHAQAGAVADYRFNHSLSDSLGLSPPLTRLLADDGSFLPVTVDSTATTMLTFSAGAGLRLPVAGVLHGDDYTIAVLMRFEQTQEWAKIIDTTALTIDDGIYARWGTVTLYPSGEQGNAEAFLSGQWYQLVVTRAIDGLTRVYIDGVEQFSHDDLETGYMAFTQERLLTFFRDDEATANWENSAGAVARIRLFDRALGPGEVAALEPNRVGEVIFRNGFELP